MLLSIDPSTTTVGAALFVRHDDIINTNVPVGHLYAADSIKLAKPADNEDPAHRWFMACLAIEGWLATKIRGSDEVTALVFERPQFYSAVKSKGDPNKLVGVLGVAAMLAGRLSMQNLRAMPSRGMIASYLPAEWIGQLSKVCPTCKGKAKKKCKDCHGSAWETPRGRRIASRLSIAERAKCPDQNDAIDAVGIGLKHLGRLEPVRVYSNGRD